MSNRGKLVVITGPSGVGKSTIVKEVLRRTGVDYSVSATTRAPRAGEVDGRDYRFVDQAAFEQMVGQGQFLEWAQVHGHCYGTPAEPIRRAVDAGRTVVLDIDIQGGLQVHGKLPEATFVLLLPPDERELQRRLAGRGSESPESLARRLGKAKEEIAAAKASGVYNHEVVNDDLERATVQVAAIVQEKR